ncbi:hypothetical protein RND81_10G053400 [Saponaria officinalis]|uniref:Nodulin homeobox N-terminal domain-containing protein n=1 Tax=Saponaria officinalis TaxID=3572 RepID=A0AAW1HZ89_SAPOF
MHYVNGESVSYLDEVASIPESLDLAKSVALQVAGLLKTMLSSDIKRPENHLGKTYPMGLLQLNALRLADVFSDDSNLRYYIDILQQERNLFLHKFLDRLEIEWQDPKAKASFSSQQGSGFAFNSDQQTAATVCKNLRSLLGHAESLIPTFLNEEDVQLLRHYMTKQ